MAITAGFQSDLRFVFFGLSTDPKPTEWNGQPVPIGSDLYLSDVNQRWKWTGSSWFNLDEVTGAEEAETEIAHEDPVLEGLEHISKQLDHVTELLGEVLS